jgi:hypothetical protein
MKFINSFKNPFILRGFVIDTLFYLLVYFISTSYFTYVQTKSYNLFGGQTPEQVQQLLLTGTVEQVQALASTLQWFAVLLVAGTVLLITAIIFGYSYSRSLIWYDLLKIKGKYWRWNLLTLLLLLLLILYGILMWLIRLITQAITQNVYVDGIVSTILFLFMFIFLFSLFRNFAQSYKVWESVGKAFEIFSKKKLWVKFLHIAGISVLLTLIFIPLNRYLYFHPRFEFIVPFLVFLLFLAWMRVYVEN